MVKSKKTKTLVAKLYVKPIKNRFCGFVIYKGGKGKDDFYFKNSRELISILEKWKKDII